MVSIKMSRTTENKSEKKNNVDNKKAIKI